MNKQKRKSCLGGLLLVLGGIALAILCLLPFQLTSEKTTTKKTPEANITYVVITNPPKYTPTRVPTKPTSSTPRATKTPKAAAPSSLGNITIKSGELYMYERTYFQYGIVNVYMKNGTLSYRNNDLEELCRDWYYYRGKILDYVAAGDESRANDAREAFSDINNWLLDYNSNDVDVMMSLVSGN